MYLKSRVKLPDVHGKLTRLRRGDITYIKYEYDRYYDPEKKYTYPQRATIGKVCPDDDTMMIPNEAFLKYFPDAVLSGMEDRTERSSCLRVGTYAVMHKIVLDYSLDKLLGQFFSERDMALLLDLASYSIVEESNVAQHYPDYAYNHPLYSSGMKIYSDASVSDFFKSIGNMINKVVQGWINYYTHYYKSEFYEVLRYINQCLIKWVRRSYKKKNTRSRAEHWLGAVARRDRNLFAHWKFGILPSVGEGAV